MHFTFTRRNLAPADHRRQRFLEILPGFVSWTIILTILLLSIIQPLAAAVVMIMLLSYWILRMLYTSIFLLIGYARLHIESKTDWDLYIQDLYHLEKDAPTKGRNPNGRNALSLVRRSSWKIHTLRKRDLYRASGNTGAAETGRPASDEVRHAILPEIEDVYHLVLFPIAGEPAEVFGAGVKALSETRFSTERMIVILAVEDRADESVKEGALQVQREWRNTFCDLLVYFHPDGIPGEERVMGANLTYAARRTLEYLDERGIPRDDVIVTTFDADTVPHPDYFGCLTYFYLSTPDRRNRSYQPIPLFTNNIWQVPAYARVLMMGYTALEIVESTNQDLMVSFSSHSIALEVLESVDFWPIDMIANDAATYWKCLINSGGSFRVQPLPTTVAMDVAESGSFARTFREIYRQQRRWAWGAETLATAIRGMIPSTKIALIEKMRLSLKLFDTHVSWATLPLLLTCMAWLPSRFAAFFGLNETVTAFNYGRIMSTIFQLSTINLLIIITIMFVLTLRNARHIPLIKRLLYPFEWVLLPIASVILSGIPALDAQTRLMFGIELSHRVARKRKGEKKGTEKSERGESNPRHELGKLG